MAKNLLRVKILQAALPDVAFDGWTEELLARAAKKSRVSPKALKQAFPDGVADLVPYFSEWADEEMQKRLKQAKKKDPRAGGTALRTRDRIALGARTRLEILAPWKQAVSAALAYLSLPPRNLALPKMVWRTADVIWTEAGDTSTNYNRYTKRFLLSGVLTATTLYWLNDASKNNARTWAFLDRRIDNVVRIGRRISSYAPARFRKERPA